MAEIAIAATAGTVAAVGALAGGLKYLDRKYSISHDIATLKKIASLKGLVKRMTDAETFSFTDVWFEMLATKVLELADADLAKHLGEEDGAKLSTEEKLALLQKLDAKAFIKDTGDLDPSVSVTLDLEQFKPFFTVYMTEKVRSFSYAQAERTIDALATWLAEEQGVMAGDTVALLMENKAEYVLWQLAITRIGAHIANINYNLKPKGLVHCLKVAGACKFVVYERATEAVIATEEVVRLLKETTVEVEYEVGDQSQSHSEWETLSLFERLSFVYWGGVGVEGAGAGDAARTSRPFFEAATQAEAKSKTAAVLSYPVLLEQLKNKKNASTQIGTEQEQPELALKLDLVANKARFAGRRAGTKFTDLMGFVFTSGTTGLPKAARITHLKHFSAGIGLSYLGSMKKDDAIYSCLPLYHISAHGIGVGSALVTGATVVIAPKFSVTKFWDDVRANDVTVLLYIGELCRYLVNHANGLRAAA